MANETFSDEELAALERLAGITPVRVTVEIEMDIRVPSDRSDRTQDGLADAIREHIVFSGGTVESLVIRQRATDG